MGAIKRAKYLLSCFWYWFRCHTFTRYHMLDCRSNSYKWGWIETDDMMMQACFALLVQFVEKQKPFGFTLYEQTDQGRFEFHGDLAENKDPFGRELIRNQWEESKEVDFLYKWWKNRDCRTEQDDEMFERLIKIRCRLWT